MSISILFILTISRINNKLQRNVFYPINKILFWIIIITIFLLTWIGARPVERPFILTGQFLTLNYFIYYIIDPITKKKNLRPNKLLIIKFIVYKLVSICFENIK